MIIYLTSSPGGSYKVDGKRYPQKLDESNQFVRSLQERWKAPAKMLIISASPEDTERNDSIAAIFEQAFPMSGLPLAKLDMLDSRREELVTKLTDYNVIILAGGHVPTQNAFFHKIGLMERIRTFQGILIGISAGTMNCAKLVYAHPELEGETEDPSYQRFIPGLGLTDLMILPHYQSLKEEFLDGKHVIEDIAFPDSMGRKIYALVDGSYVIIENGVVILYGEGYLIGDGEIRQICEQGQSIALE